MSASVYRLDDYRPFNAGTPVLCYGCGAHEGVRQVFGEGGYVWACPECPHPEDWQPQQQCVGCLVDRDPHTCGYNPVTVPRSWARLT